MNSKPLPNPFKVEPINSYGRRVIHNQEMAHNRLVDKATCMTDCRMSDISKQQRTFHREAQGWKLSYNEMVQRSMEDQLLSHLITNSVSQLDRRLDAHILAFKEARMRHPNHKPGWLEAQEQHRRRLNHQAIITGDHIRARVDARPPWVALRYGQFLKSTRFTKGGAPRASSAQRSKRPPIPTSVAAKFETPGPRDMPADSFLPLRRHQAMSVMGVAGEPELPAPAQFHLEYQVHEFPLGSEDPAARTTFPPIGNTHSQAVNNESEADAEADYDDEGFEDDG